jgi:hypothetical protein
LWQTTTLFAQPWNVVGQLFAASLLLQSYGSSFASAIPQLAFTYLVFLAVGMLVTVLDPGANDGGRVRVAPPRSLQRSANA